MGLSKEQFGQSMKRILVMFPFKAGDGEIYADGIFEHVAWMDSYKFEQTALRVARDMKRERPKASSFIGTYKFLAEEMGWDRTDPKTLCPSCHGMGLTPGFYMVNKNPERVVEAHGPCPGCQPQANKNIKPELEPVPWRDWRIEAAKTMKPSRATQTLELIDAKRITAPSDDVIVALVERAGEEEPASSAAAESEGSTPSGTGDTLKESGTCEHRDPPAAAPVEAPPVQAKKEEYQPKEIRSILEEEAKKLGIPF